MSRKVKTPKFLMRDFSLNIWFTVSISLILMVLFFCAKEIDSTVYKDNHLKAKVEGNNLIIKNSNKVSIAIMVLNDKNKFNYNVEARTEYSIELLPGVNKVFVECEYFEDSFEVSSK